jgi:hypothetical protein
MALFNIKTRTYRATVVATVLGHMGIRATISMTIAVVILVRAIEVPASGKYWGCVLLIIKQFLNPLQRGQDSF